MPRKSTKNTSQILLNLETSETSKQKHSERLTFLLSDFLAKIYQSLEKGQGLEAQEVVCSLKRCGLLTNSSPLYLSLKTSKGFLQATTEKTLKSYCERLPTLGFMSANGNLLILLGYYPKIESGFTLSDILEKKVDKKYFLSERMKNYLIRKPTMKSHLVSNPHITRGGVGAGHTLVCNNLDYIGAIMSEKNKKWLEDGKKLQRNFPQGQRVYSTRGIASSICGQAGGLGGKTGLYCVAQRGREKGQQLEIRDDADKKTNALTSVQKDNLIIDDNFGIRRLTPTEGLRLQGFPDDYLTGSDTKKYIAIGNAVSIPIVKMIIERLYNQEA